MAEKKSKMAEKIGQSGGGKILKHGHYAHSSKKIALYVSRTIREVEIERTR